MTELLERAIAKLEGLPATVQDAIATMILEELEDERQWDDAFAHSQDALAKLAGVAMQEYRSDKTQELDAETLITPELSKAATLARIRQLREKTSDHVLTEEELEQLRHQH